MVGADRWRLRPPNGPVRTPRGRTGTFRRTVAACVWLLICRATPLAAQQNSLHVQWGSNATEYRGQNGRRLTVICPPGGHAGDVYGTDVYTDDSLICPAAAHAGLIRFADGGPVTLIVAPGDSVYQASLRNGVSSRAFGSWHGSYRFDRDGGAGQIEWKTTALGLTSALVRPLTLTCPPGGALGAVWGTDTYTDDSSICSAAVHAGVIGVAAGGAVTLQTAVAVESYTASSRNGVASREYGARPNGFSVSGGVVAAMVPVGDAAEPAVTAPAVAAPTHAVAASSRTGQTAVTRAPMPTTGASGGTSRVTTTRTANGPIARSPSAGITPSGMGAMQPTSVPSGRPPARAQAEARAGMNASSRLPSDPPAVHATGFTVFAGYGRIVLNWKPVNGALGYRLARASWDPAKNAWIQGSEVEIPTEPVSANSRIYMQVWENTGGIDEFDRPAPWTLSSESTFVSSAVEFKSGTVITHEGNPSRLRREVTVVSPAGLIADTTFTDMSVAVGTQYVYWLDTWFRSGSGTFYAPNTTPYPTVTAIPRDPALMEWLPSESERLTAPILVGTVPDAKGVRVNWTSKFAAAGYLVMRTLRTSTPLLPGEPCYPRHIEGIVQNSTSMYVTDFDPKQYPSFCIGIFAIYPTMVLDGTPTLDLRFEYDAWGKHTNWLMDSEHSDGLFIWAEWDAAAGKWRVLRQDTFKVSPCVTQRTNRTHLQCDNL